MRIFKNLAFGFLAASIICFAAGCSNVSLDGSSDDLEYGSLTVADAGRSVNADEIKSCIVTVTGYDANGTKFEKTSGTVSMSEGAGTATVKDIPVSKNVAVMVQAYSDSSAATKLDGTVIYAKTDIVSGSNTVSVTQGTSNVGSVFAKLIASGVNTNKISDTSTLVSAIPTSVNYSLIDSAAIVTDYNASSLKASSNYVKAAATVNVTPSDISGYKVQISDPNSAVSTMGTDSVAYAVAPGSWTIYAIDSDGTVKASKGITVTSGSTTPVTVKKSTGNAADLTGKTIIFVKASSAPTIWAWETSGSSVKLCEKLDYSWSSQPTMTAVTSEYMTDYSGWYMFDFSSVASGGNITFKLNSGSDIATSLSGCIWYDGSSCTNTNPSAATATGEEKVTITVGESQGGEIDLTKCIKIHSQYSYIYVWETGTSVDKTHNAMTSEGSGWYSYVINSTSANIIFENDAAWSSKTSDLSRTSAGEYWYYNGSWYDYNPIDTTAPVLVSFTSDKTGTVSGDVTFTVSATDDKNLSKAILATSTGTTIGTISLSGTSATGSCVWSTAKIQNGSYTINCTLFDAGGNSVTGTAITLTTSNENLPPVAVIGGTKRAACGKSVTYRATSSYDQNGGTIASYAWTLSGSGATISSGADTDTLVVKTSSTAGATYSLSLVVTDNDGAASSSVSIECTTIAVDSNWDFRDESVYFLITTRFYDGDTGNNVYGWDEGSTITIAAGDPGWRGDFKGLIEKLDYIKALGFTTIWITPVVVNASGVDYHGYHAFDFSHVDPRYASGTKKYDVDGDDISGDEAYQELIDAVHSKGMKIMQDIVLNHTGNWGERNLNHLFDKGSTYTDANGYTRAPAMVPNEDSDIMKAACGVHGYSSYADALSKSGEYDVRLTALKDDNVDPAYYHHEGSCEYKDITYIMGSMAGDCVDLNTENPTVQNYLVKSYSKYINMGVDAFRIDTTKHITRAVFNKVFNPAFHAAAAANGNDKFYMVGEVCARWNGRWSDNDIAQGTPSFYSWKDSTEDDYDRTDEANWTNAAHKAKTSYPYTFWDRHGNEKWISILNSIKPSVANHKLSGNNYHTPDYTNYSGLNTIDFKMHWAFKETGDAFAVAKEYDDDICDASWQMVYVDSHDYAPDQAPENQRFTGNWPDKLNLIFTFRGIPCIYYGSEIEFKKGLTIDPANTKTTLENSGRAYFGDNLEGTVTASDFGEYTASGTVAETLNHDLAQHIIRLNKIRAAIPALRKGQYSTADCSGSISFKRRYTKDGVDSFALVTINGGATFSNIPNGNYVEVVTGKTVPVSGGSLTSDTISQDNMRVYVLQTNDGVEPTGKIGTDGAYLN